MSSTLEQQEKGQQHSASTPHKSNVTDSIQVEPLSSSQVKDEYHALATQTATLDSEDQDDDLDLSSKDDKDTWSDEDAPPETDDENSEPQPTQATATAPANSVRADQNKSTEDVKTADNATTPKHSNPEDEDDETNTPHFQTYVNLHNEMMTSKTALTTDTTELVNHYNHASRLARILLSSHEKHDDLPLVIHAQACLVLGCSDEDDCYERMEDAVWLLNHAMEEGALQKEQGQAMIKTCEAVMGMRGQRIGASDDEDGEEDGEDEGEEDGQAENDKLDEGKDEAANDGEGYGKNDAFVALS